MITGHGSLDDSANLMANLMKNGKIDVAAKLITQGAFGEVEGVTPTMSEADKKMYEIQAKQQKSIDDIKKAVNDSLPSSVKSLALIAAAWTPIIGTLAAITKMTWATMFSTKMIASSALGGVVKTMDVSKGLGGGKLSGKGGGKLGGNVKNLLGKGGGKLGGIVGKIGSSIGKVIAKAGPFVLIGAALHMIGDYVGNIAKEVQEKNKQERKGSLAKNKQLHGMSVMTHKTKNKGKQYAATVGGNALKGAGIGVAIGGAIGSIIPGIGTAVGAAIGGGLGLIAGSIKGVIDATKQSNEDKEWDRIADIGREAVRLSEGI